MWQKALELPGSGAMRLSGTVREFRSEEPLYSHLQTDQRKHSASHPFLPCSDESLHHIGKSPPVVSSLLVSRLWIATPLALPQLPEHWRRKLGTLQHGLRVFPAQAEAECPHMPARGP